ncbi:MAG: alpha/beta hydrolase [Proteobacteria bacterium]|nr:alpha/beta hydrolase [Pseudomonadota bacterium]
MSKEPNRNDRRLYYEVHGTNGPFLLLVHGLLSSRGQWIPNLKALSEFCRPVVAELFGHGRSPSPKNPECYTPDSYIGEFERIRGELGAERWFVCGQSLGASLTLRYAVYHPERIPAQIFTNSRSALTDESFDEVMQMMSKRLEAEGRKVIDEFPLHPSMNRRMQPEIKEVLVKDAESIDVDGFSNTGLYTVARGSVRDILHRNRVPTLLIAGRFDKQFAPLLEIAEKTIPELELLVLDAGHAVNIDAPDRFNTAVKEFVSRFD